MHRMSEADELERFRNEWREELTKSKEKPSQPVGDNNKKPAHHAAENVVNPIENLSATSLEVEDSSTLEDLCNIGSVEAARKRPNVIPSFVIAENLLRECGTKKPRLDQDGPEILSSKNNSSLEIIPHTEGAAKKKEEERFLDIFLHDLVREFVKKTFYWGER